MHTQCRKYIPPSIVQDGCVYLLDAPYIEHSGSGGSALSYNQTSCQTDPTHNNIVLLHFSKYEVIFHLHSSKHILRPTCRTDFICANLVAPFKSYRMVLFLWSSEGANKNVQRINDPGQSSHDRTVCVQQLLQDEWNKTATPISYGG